MTIESPEMSHWHEKQTLWNVHRNGGIVRDDAYAGSDMRNTSAVSSAMWSADGDGEIAGDFMLDLETSKPYYDLFSK